MEIFETEELYETALFVFNFFEEEIKGLVKEIASQTDKREEVIERARGSVVYEDIRQFAYDKIKKDKEYIGEEIKEEELNEIVDSIMIYIDEMIADEVDFLFSTN